MKIKVKSKDERNMPCCYTFFTVSLCLSTIIVATLFAPIYIPFRLIGRLNKSSANMASSIAQWMAHLILDLQPWLKYSAKINLPITRRKIILVSNHRSNLDVFILFGNIPRLRVVAKQMLFNLPILGIGMKALNQIPLNKKNWALVPRAIEKMRAGMCAGDHILFFPEMTRCQWGMEKTNKFVEIPFTVAKKENALVVPLVIINTDNAWPKKSIGISYRAPCEVISLDPIDSNNYDKPHELKCEVQRLIDEALLQRS